MATVPKNDKAAKTAGNMRQLGVFISDDADTDPTKEQEKIGYHAIEVADGVGRSMPRAIISVDLAHEQSHIEDERLIKDMNRRCEVWIMKEVLTEEDEENLANGDDDKVDTREECIHRGEIVGMKTILAAQPGGGYIEQRVLVSTVKDYRFGDTIDGQLQFSHLDSERKVVHRDLEFNPEVDGKVVFNMNTFANEGIPYFVDAESSQTTEAVDEYFGLSASGPDDAQTFLEWKLEDIVEGLQNAANEDEDYIQNTPRDRLDDVIGSQFVKDPTTGFHGIVNRVLKRCERLDVYLSQLLPPYGFNWYLDNYKAKDDESSDVGPDKLKTRISVYKRGQGEGQPKKLYLQKRGTEKLDPAKSHLSGISVDYDVGSLFNRVKVYGGFKRYEITVPLIRGWRTAEDDDFAHADRIQNPGRLWVANEGADYTGFRVDTGDPPDLFYQAGVHPHTIPKRRQMEDCLALTGANTTPPVLEMSLDDGETWVTKYEDKDLESYGFTRLNDRIGIRWTGEGETSSDGIPEFCLEETTRFRITCTVTSDYRLEYETEPAENSPNSVEVLKVVDASDQFIWEKRVTTGPFASTASHPITNRDDTTRLEEYAEALLETAKAAQVDTQPVRLPGLRTDYKLADVIEKVDGRNISLSRQAEGATDKEYPQVVARRWINSDGQQWTELTIARFDL